MFNMNELFLGVPALAPAIIQSLGIFIGLTGVYFICAGIWMFRPNVKADAPLVVISCGVGIVLMGIVILGLFFVVATWEPVVNQFKLGLQALGIGVILVTFYAVVDAILEKVFPRFKFKLEETVAIIVPTLGFFLCLGGIGTIVNACVM